MGLHPTELASASDVQSLRAQIAGLENDWRRADVLIRQLQGGSPFITNEILPPGQLPALAERGDMCLFEASVTDPSYGDYWLGVFDPAIGGIGAWRVVGNASDIVDTGTPGTLASASGWRKPAPTISCAVPYTGSYYVDGIIEFVAGAVDVIIGIGFATSDLAATSSPPIQGTGGQYPTTARRFQLVTRTGSRINVTTSAMVIDMRASTSAASTLTFATAAMAVRPVYCYGVM